MGYVWVFFECQRRLGTTLAQGLLLHPASQMTSETTRMAITHNLLPSQSSTWLTSEYVLCKLTMDLGRKHPRLAANAVDTTQPMGEDMLKLVATFTSCSDLCRMGCVSKRFASLPRDESVWTHRALDILPAKQLYAAMSELHLTSCRQLIEVFTRIGIPSGVLGFWRADAPLAAAVQLSLSSRLLSSTTAAAAQDPTAEKAKACGELLRISLDSGGFLCESIAPNGTSRGIFAIRVSRSVDQKMKVGFFSLEEEASTPMGGSGWVPGRSIGEAFLEYAKAIPSAAERTPLRPSGRDAFYLDRVGGRTCRFTKMKPPADPPLRVTPLRNMMPAAVAADLCGLWCAPYGNHGLEIIQLSVDPTSAGPPATGSRGREAAAAKAKATRLPTRDEAFSWMSQSTSSNASSNSSTCYSESACTSAPATDSSEDGFDGSCSSMESDDSGDERDPTAAAASSTRKRGTSRGGRYCTGDESGVAGRAESESAYRDGRDLPPQLFGLKVTGDVNVPAGKTSFAIDLETDCSIDEELEADTRPVILFLPSGAVMANLSNRREQISFWRKGRGQINRVPDRWAPEWVDVDFVVYKAGSRYAFSVVFRQPTQAVRVTMDFERALGSKEEWPRWTALSSSSTA